MFWAVIGVVWAEMVWRDPDTGLYYDWSALQQPVDKFYTVKDSYAYYVPSVYTFNFDIDLPDTCAGQTVTAVESISLDDGWVESCSIMGRKDMEEVKSIDGGVQVTYTGGDVCYEVSELSHRQVSFQLICSEKEDVWEIYQSTFVDYCHVILRKKTPSGCPSQSKSWLIGLGLIVAGLVAYCAVGAYLNYSRQEKVEIPHKDFWEKALKHTSSCFESITEKVKDFINKPRGGPSKNYEMV
jgi:hypothetical protein